MSFTEQLTEYSAAQIVAAINCPRATAYAWLDGTRTPPEWQQPHWLRIIAAHAKRHNKTPHGTPRKRSGEAEI